MPDQCRRDAALNRFWNELLQPAAGAGAADRDLATDQADTLRRIHAMTQTPPPAGARARVDDAMRVHLAAHQNGKDAATMSQMEALTLRPPGGLPQPLPLQRLAAPAAGGTEPRRNPWLAQFATAALLLLTIGLGYVAFGPGRQRLVSPPPTPAAVMAPAIASPAADGTLFSIVLPAEQMPTKGPFDLVLWNFSLAPGAVSPVAPDAQTCCVGPQLTHVVAGEITLTVDGPVRLYRANGDPGEDVAPGAGITLGVGDTAVYDYALPTEFANPGSNAAKIVSGGFWSGQLARPPFDDGNFVDASEIYPDAALPAGPVRADLTRVTLPGKGATVPPPPGSLVVQVGAEGDVSIGENSDGSLRNVGGKPATIYVLTLTPAALLASPPAATAGTEPTLDTVLTTTLPAALAPTAGNLDYVLWHAVLDPGQHARFAAEEVDCCPGPQVTHLVSGELALQVDGPVQVFRGDGIATGVAGAAEAAAGAEIVLRPGDTAIYDFARPAEFTSRGADPAHIVGGGLLAGSMSWTPAGMTVLDGNEEYSVPALPPGPVEVTLVRAVLPPEGIVPAPPIDSLVLEAGAFGDAAVAQRGDGALRNIGDEATTIYVLTVIPAGTGPSA